MIVSQSKTEWKRVSRSNPCPVCGRPDWCMYTGPDGNADAAICSRIESDKQVGNENAGWLHQFRNDDDWQRPRRQTATVRSSAPPEYMPDLLAALAAKCEMALTVPDCESLAARLGVSMRSLQRLGVGWSEQHHAYSFPMKDCRYRVCGIRLRGHVSKWSVKGGREGVFIPYDLPSDDDLLLVCEGPTDTAAMLDLGFVAVGRPSCTGGGKHLIEVVIAQQPREVIIVADADTPGLNGARNLAVALTPYCWGIRTITPPPGVKDARAWVNSGAHANDVIDAIERTPALRLTMQSREAGR